MVADDALNPSEFLERIRARPYTRQPVDDGAYPDANVLLDAVIEHFLGADKFNGMPFPASTGAYTNLETLISDGLIQLVTNTDCLNTHIRPWVKGDVDRQLKEVAEVAAGAMQACLYPTAVAMDTRRPELSNGARPFTDRMTMGRAGSLDCAYFEIAAIEGYLNDPAFELSLGDDGFSLRDVPDVAIDLEYEDMTSLQDVGYAYERTADLHGDQPFKRYWAAFVVDLTGLPPKHQQRLHTNEVDGSGLAPHPHWYRRQMGEWLDVVGPFTKVILEMKAINDLWNLAFGTDIFKSVERPATWGWVLRPTTRDWDNFLLTTSALLIDGLSPKGLDAAGAAARDERGQPLGTLLRLEALMVARTRADFTKEKARALLQPLHDIRKGRQGPAHKNNSNTVDPLILNRQRDLMAEIAQCLMGIRHFIGNHPKVTAARWSPSAYIDKWIGM